MTKKNHIQFRQEILSAPLDKTTVNPDPISQFGIWYSHAEQSGIAEPGAMTLATVAPDGRPKARVVLLKSFDEQGFVFFTNYESAKAMQLSENPLASMVFLWLELQRQVRIEGRTEKIAESESDEYFGTRPRASQLGAWASPQSQEIPSRAYLDDRFLEQEKIYQGKEIPRPVFWGGYRVIPAAIEFWQGRDGRLHDRLLYRQTGRNWNVIRLAP